MTLFYLWIPALIILCVAEAYVGVISNNSKDWKWFFICWVLMFPPMWPLISRYSKNIIRDGLIFDALSTSIYLIVPVCMGLAKDFSWAQWAGVGLIFTGLILMKLGEAL